ncbi:putative quinol monooxygenase [Streptomyces sp. NPDC007157]|uniref:putative quinol monooxygenase n=1 Tax=Streptomyces sp. NPDC007157 TaxID=3154681 RepID=UPI0033FD78F8
MAPHEAGGVLEVPGLGTRLELRLDPATATALEGYDFLTLAVDDQAALGQWITRLDTLGIPHSPPVVALAGWPLVIPDPDGQRLRLYTTTPHGLNAVCVEFDSPWLSTGPAPEPSGAHVAKSVLRIVTTATARPGVGRELERMLLELAAATRREDGCLDYRVHRAEQTPDTFVVYEQWTGRQALDAHHATPHMNTFRTNAADLMGRATTSGTPHLVHPDLTQMSARGAAQEAAGVCLRVPCRRHATQADRSSLYRRIWRKYGKIY